MSESTDLQPSAGLEPLDAADTAQTTLSHSIELFSAESYSGPLPSATELMRYEQALPGLAERIVRAWEVEREHVRRLEAQDLNITEQDLAAESRLAARGQLLAAILAALFFSGSLFLVMTGHKTAGLAIIIAEIAALCGAFIYGRRSDKAGAEGDSQNVP